MGRPPLPLGEISLPPTEKCLSLTDFCPQCLVYIGMFKNSVFLKLFLSTVKIPLCHISSRAESSEEVMNLHMETSVERKKCGTNSS